MRRFFRILKWCVLGLLGILGIFLTINGIRAARAGARFEAKITALRAEGQPVSLADLARKPIPPEQNAETYLRRAKSDVDAIEKEVQAACDAAPKADQDAFDEGRPTPALRQSMRAALAAYSKAMPLIVEASRCPDYDLQLDFNVETRSHLETMLDEVQTCRAPIRVAKYCAQVQLDDGQPAEAFETCLAMFRLARLMDRNPGLVSNLVGLAVRGVAVDQMNLVLQAGPLPEADYATLEEELARHDLVEGYRQSIRTERAFGIQTFREWSRGVMAPTVRLIPWFKNEACNYLDAMEQSIQDAALPCSEWDAKMQAMIDAPDVGIFTRLLIPALQQSHNATFRVQAEFRALRVLNALLSREEGGAAAEPTLADLGLPPDVTTDPFNGEPLHVKKLPGGWLVYSVGQNLTDDGGDLIDNRDVGVGPPPAPQAAGNADSPPESPAG